MNNSDFGMTIQSIVCDAYGLIPCSKAQKNFQKSFNNLYKDIANKLIKSIFDDLESTPVKCTTDVLSKDGKSIIPYNFVLKNGKTLSIRTSKKGKMVAPRVIGQAGYDVLNLYFEDVIGEKLFSQEQIRKAVYKNIKDMLPTFVTFLLNSDYTVWIYPKEKSYDFIIIDNNTAVDIEYDDKFFSFTKELKDWTESITLKYNNVSIAEIQTHKNRTFKFRFNFPNLIKLFIKEKITTETIGVSAESVICSKFNLPKPQSFNKRTSQKIENELMPVIEDAFKHMPKAIKYVGSEKGVRKGTSKSPFDFILEGNKTLSVKTDISKMVCPPEIGQPNDKTFYLYFKNLLEENYVNEQTFKNLVLSKPDKMIPMYIDFLFSADYLLRLYKANNKWQYQIYNKNFGNRVKWISSKFSFSKPEVNDWNESNTIKYKNRRLGEFQYHHHRNCYKFRFDFDNLIKLIEEYSKTTK